MKIRWWILLLLVVGLIAGPAIKNIPGFVVVAVNQTTMQFPLWLGVALVLLLIIMTGILLAIFGKFTAVAIKAKSWTGLRKWRKARKETIDGMLEFSEGNWLKAEKKMIKASHYGDTKLINFLIAAEAAQKRMVFDKRDEYLKQAKIASPNADIAIGLTQARLQIESEQYEEALASLILLLELAPKNKYINKLFVEVNLQLEEWRVVLEKIPLLEKQKSTTEKKLNTMYKKAICGVMLNEFDRSKWQKLQLFWKQQPTRLKKDPELLLEYVTLLHRFGRDEEVEPPLKKLLKQKITSPALKLYATLHTKTPGKQLDFLESLDCEKAIEVDYYEALSALATTAELWGKSKDYLQQSIDLSDNAKTRTALASTLIKLGEADEAQIQREKAVNLIERDDLTKTKNHI